MVEGHKARSRLWFSVRSLSLCGECFLTRTLLTSEPLFGDPVIYITRTMDERDAFRLTRCEEANDIQVDETDFVQVERDVRSSGLYLRFQFFDMLPPHAANKP
jgi:hypothetical protein